VMSTSESSIPAEISFFNSEKKTWLLYNSTCLHHDQDCSLVRTVALLWLFYMLMNIDKNYSYEWFMNSILVWDVKLTVRNKIQLCWQQNCMFYFKIFSFVIIQGQE
jgi:hypothetical protein